MGTRFGWRDTAQVLGELSARSGPFDISRSGAWFEAPGVRAQPPMVLPWAGLPELGERAGRAVPTAQELAARQRARGEGADMDGACALAAYARGLAERTLGQGDESEPVLPPLRFVVLFQAGAASLGAFAGEAALATKATKRYVVRGVGRSQSTHLSAKGKSRYGSRLRLRNVQRLFDEVHAKLAEFRDRFGAPELAFVAAPERLWSDFLASADSAPFGEHETPTYKVPFDVPVPVTAVLLDVDRELCTGRVERSPVSAEGCAPDPGAGQTPPRTGL